MLRIGILDAKDRGFPGFFFFFFLLIAQVKNKVVPVTWMQISLFLSLTT